MDNFKRKPSRSRNTTTSVDGFVRGGRSRHASRAQKTAKPNEKLNARRDRIADFKKPDGFYGTKSPNLMSRLSGDEESITLDMPKAPRRRKQSQKKELKSKRHIARKALSTMLIIFLLGGGYLFGKGYLSILNIFRGGGNALALEENIDPSRLRGEGDGRVNILLLGRGGEGHDGADLTDTIIVASIDPVNKKTALLSIPRDLYVNLGDYGSMKINQVFFTGKNYDVKENEQPNDAGMRLLEKTLENTIGIPIHYHVLVDFEGFRKTIDTVGGIETNVPKELAVYEYYPESGYVLDVDAGNQKFDGLRALAFARTRKTSARGDFDRSERQRLMMIALKDKVFSLGTFGNPVTVNKLIGDFGNHITSNFTTEEVLRIYEIMQDVPNDQIASVGLADEPQSLVTTGNINGLSVVIPRAGAFQYDAIKHFVRNALRDGFLENENASVDVYNGTYIGGLAGRTADELESFGYSVGTVADAPQKGMQDTVLIDLTGGDKKYTKSYLETRFGVTALTSMPSGTGIDPGQANFVIILGQNEERRLEN